MRTFSMIALLSSIVIYVLAVFVKLDLISLWGTRPVSLIGIAGVNAVIAIAFGVLSLGKK
jgi:hypothetical protein